MRYAQAQSVANPAAERTNLGQNTGGANREHGIDRRVALCCVNDQCQHTFPQNPDDFEEFKSTRRASPKFSVVTERQPFVISKLMEHESKLFTAS